MTTPAPARAPSAALLDSLRSGEGLRLHAYPDPLSHGAPWTIGYGHAGRCGPHDTCTTAQAEIWLQEDARAAVGDLLQHFPWAAHLDAVRFDVLAEMAFNLGWRGLASFSRTLGDVAAAHYASAADRMLASSWAGQVGDRAKRLAQAMRTGKR